MNPEDRAWMDQGACVGVDAEVFFPSRGENDKAEEARKYCWACPVRSQCLEYALANGEKFGMWGGMSERQRRQIRKQRKHFRSVA
jgi:WhiB family redox-sensing transcriptional regulator